MSYIKLSQIASTQPAIVIDFDNPAYCPRRAILQTQTPPHPQKPKNRLKMPKTHGKPAQAKKYNENPKITHKTFQNPPTSPLQELSPSNPQSTSNSFQNQIPNQFQNQLPGDFQNQAPQNSNIEYPDFQTQTPAQPKTKNPQDAALFFNTNAVGAELGSSAENNTETTATFKIKKSYKTHDSLVIGVVSTQPAIVIEGGRIVAMGGYKGQNNTLKPAIALAGRVPVKATAENGPIQKGDLLTTSSKPGYAMKCEVKDIDLGLGDKEKWAIVADNEKCRNSIIGKALESLESGEGKILMFVSTQ